MFPPYTLVTVPVSIYTLLTVTVPDESEPPYMFSTIPPCKYIPLVVSSSPEESKSADFPPLNAFVIFAFVNKYTFTVLVLVSIPAWFPPPYIVCILELLFSPILSSMSPLIVPFMLLPPNILHFSRLLPSTFSFLYMN